MSGSATVAEGAAENLSAALQSRIRAFTAFYEQHAYLAYNLALRITCEPEPAMRAVQEAFLTQLDDRPAGLLPATVAAALHEAPAHPKPEGAGDPQAAALLSAVAELAPPERAALALADLSHAGPDGIGEALGLDGEQASKLLHRGREAFGARLGLPRTQADQVAQQWMWAAPPDVIWEELYPRFHQAAERQLRRGASEQTLVLSAAETSPAGGPAPARRRRRRRAWARRPRWAIVVPLLALLALGGAAAAVQLTSAGDKPEKSTDEATPPSDAPALPSDSAGVPPASDESTVKPHTPLTAAQLDKLRLRELAMLRRYAKRQADKSLPSAQRTDAARQIDALQRAAQRRIQAESRRDRVARDQLARQRAKAKAPPPPPPPATSAPRTAPKPKTAPPKRQSTAPSGAAPTKEEADKTCLLDEDSGQYICPQ